MLAFVYFPQEERYDPKLHNKWTWSVVYSAAAPKLSEKKYKRKTQLDISDSTTDI
jgi:hypothetical protein